MIMMTPPSELSFDFKPHMYSMIVKSNGDQAETTHESPHMLEEFLARLEEERLKIEAFKRELPLCMELLNNAMEASRQQLQYQQRANQETRPVLEEFIPLKNMTSNNSSEVKTENLGNICADHKVNWMTSAQLWNQESEVTKPSSPLPTSPKETEDIKLALNGKQRINGGSGAFLPFSKDRNSSSAAAFPELALASSHKEEVDDKRNISSETNSRRSENTGSNRCCNGNSVAEKNQVCGTATANQTQRKARRCWSPDLHRRFVNALHMLGGSQVATPKQIRELMKVDGLTNDEVKSHLQKYRLHTRRPSPSPQAAVTTPPQVVVLGGIWVPQEYAAAAAHGGTPTALYGAHASTTHHVSPPFCSTTQPVVLPQEIYPAIAPPPPPQPPNHQLHHHHHPFHHQHQLHVYNNKPPALLTQRPGSPDSDVPGSGDPSESIEDGKSESSSWKVDSGGGGGENGGERKRMDVEEGSNASVSLKF